MSTLRSVTDVAHVVRAAMSPDYRIVVGIVGSPGAGKSTLAEQLVGELGGSAALLPMDGFHLPPQRLVELGSRDRMGAPDTFDVAGFRATLVAVRRGFQNSGHGPEHPSGTVQNSGSDVLAPGFNRVTEQPVKDAIVLSPESCCVVVEGNYLLLESGGWERVGPLLDLTFFLELEHSVRLERLVARHERFGKSPADALRWATGPDEANSRLIEATATRADYRIALG